MYTNIFKHLRILIPIMATTLFLTSCISGGKKEQFTENWNGPVEPLTKVSEYEYEIHSAAQLAALAQFESFSQNNTYTLKADIDLEGRVWNPIGNPLQPAKDGDGETLDKTKMFRGIFDGGGHTIKGLVLPKKKSYIGLFGYISGDRQNAIVKNLKIELSKGDIDRATCVGVLAGYASYADIDKISVSGADLHVKTWSPCIGGIVGSIWNTNISSSFSSINIIAEGAPNSVSAGGIAGQSTGIIFACYATGNVSIIGEEHAAAGGIVGTNSGVISDCFAVGNITAESKDYVFAGGIAGSLEHSDEIGNKINNCVALNKYITASGKRENSFVGRIASKVFEKTSFLNNAANINMELVQGDIRYPAANTLNNGTQVKPTSLTKTIFLNTGPLKTNSSGVVIGGGFGWNSTIWFFPLNELPKLKWQVE